MSKFIKATESDRLVLSDGDWVEVKRRLSFGEEQRLAGSGITGIKSSDTETNEMGFDLEKFSVDRIFIWGLGWNFKDDDNKDVKFTRSAIAALDPDIAVEIGKLLDEHIEKMESLKKKTIGMKRTSK